MPNQSFNSIAVYSTTALGDFMFATPAIHALRQHYPEAQIILLVDSKFKEFVNDSYPDVNHVLYWDGKWDGLFKISKALRAFKPELAVSLHAHSPYEIISAAVAKIPYVLINNYFPDIECFLPWVTAYRSREGGMHEVEQRLELVKRLGCSVADKQMRIPCAYEHLSRKPDRKIIGLQMGTSNSDLKRRWPVTHFARLAQLLIQSCPKVEIALIGASNEMGLVAEFLALLSEEEGEKVVNYIGKTSVTELISVIEQMDLLVTTNTGPLHLAAAVNTPIIALFPEDATAARPYHQENPEWHTVLETEIDSTTGKRLPMSTISAPQVFQAAVHRLKQDNLTASE